MNHESPDEDSPYVYDQPRPWYRRIATITSAFVAVALAGGIAYASSNGGAPAPSNSPITTDATAELAEGEPGDDESVVIPVPPIVLTDNTDDFDDSADDEDDEDDDDQNGDEDESEDESDDED